MPTITHKLSASEAHQIKQALLEAAKTGMGLASPEALAQGLIKAFLQVDEATSRSEPGEAS